jgi:hypothetical protein
VLRSLRFSGPLSLSRQDSGIARLSRLSKVRVTMAFAVIPLRLAPFVNPRYRRERFAFDLRLGAATVTGPGIRCFLRALTPAVHSGCEMKAVTLF